MTAMSKRWSAAILLLGGFAPAAEPDTPADLVKRARAFVELVAKNDFDGAAKQYDEAMTKALPPAKLGETWKMIVDGSGPFQKQLGTRTEKRGKYDIVFVTTQKGHHVIGHRSFGGDRLVVACGEHARQSVSKGEDARDDYQRALDLAGNESERSFLRQQIEKN